MRYPFDRPFPPARSGPFRELAIPDTVMAQSNFAFRDLVVAWKA